MCGVEDRFLGGTAELGFVAVWCGRETGCAVCSMTLSRATSAILVASSTLVRASSAATSDAFSSNCAVVSEIWRVSSFRCVSIC